MAHDVDEPVYGNYLRKTLRGPVRALKLQNSPSEPNQSKRVTCEGDALGRQSDCDGSLSGQTATAIRAYKKTAPGPLSKSRTAR